MVNPWYTGLVKLIISSDGVDLSPDIEKLLQRKLNQKLEKYIKGHAPDTKEARITIERRSRWGFKVTFRLGLPDKKYIHAEEVNKELSAAITIVSEEAERQLRKIKEMSNSTK